MEETDVADPDLTVVRPEMAFIEVAPEMTALLGRGVVGETPLPADPVLLAYGFGENGSPPTLRLQANPSIAALRDEPGEAWRVVFLVDRAAVGGVGGRGLVG